MLDLSLDHNVLINTELEAAVQELNIIFNTETTVLIGCPTFGTNFEQFLSQYKRLELLWSKTEALRLALWLVSEADEGFRERQVNTVSPCFLL